MQEVKDIMLKYPAYDPETAKELFGVILPGQKGSEEEGSGVVSPKGRSFHNGRFVQRLRERALAEPNVTVVEGIVSKLLQVGGTGVREDRSMDARAHAFILQWSQEQHR